MLTCTGSGWLRRFGQIAIALLVAACASSGPKVPPVSLPEPLAIAGPEPVRQRTRPAKPVVVPTGTSTPEPVPSARSREPERGSQPPRTPQPPRSVLPRPTAKARVDSAALERAITKRFAYQPLSAALSKRTRKTELADRIAAAVVYEAERNRLSPSLVAAVLLIENAPFDTTAISSQGAVGLMQVMPVHIGSWGCPSRDLNGVEANICHGARILHNYIKRAKSVPLGLKRYNGCVRGRNTPRCYRYPSKVLRVASKLRHEMLVSAAGFDGGLVPDDLVMGEPAPVSVPSQPMLAPDTSITTAAECTTFMGCLRNRWTSR